MNSLRIQEIDFNLLNSIVDSLGKLSNQFIWCQTLLLYSQRISLAHNVAKKQNEKQNILFGLLMEPYNVVCTIWNCLLQ